MSVMASQPDHEFPKGRGTAHYLLSPWLPHNIMRGTHGRLVSIFPLNLGNPSTEYQYWPWVPQKPWWWPSLPFDYSCRQYASRRLPGPHSQTTSTYQRPSLCSRTHRWAFQTSALAENWKALVTWESLSNGVKMTTHGIQRYRYILLGMEKDADISMCSDEKKWMPDLSLLLTWS